MLAILSDTSIIVLVVLVLVLFGGSQLPKLAKNLGSAGKEFRKAQAEAEAEHAAQATAPPATPLPPATDDKVTLSKGELDALLAEREAQARRESSAS